MKLFLSPQTEDRGKKKKVKFKSTQRNSEWTLLMFSKRHKPSYSKK